MLDFDFDEAVLRDSRCRTEKNLVLERKKPIVQKTSTIKFNKIATNEEKSNQEDIFVELLCQDLIETQKNSLFRVIPRELLFFIRKDVPNFFKDIVRFD